MEYIRSILLAFAMFSRLPVPQPAWDAGNMRRLMAVFPLVGVVAGLLAVAWGQLCPALCFGPFLRGVGFAVIPIAFTGGIHMDGLCDTTDALASHGDAEKKRRILRDPHIGSFGAVMAAVYLLVFSALGSELASSGDALLCFGLAFVLSRAVAGLAILLFPASASSSLGKTFRDATAKRSSLVVLSLWLCCLGCLMSLLGGWPGAAAFVLPCLLLARCGRMAARDFGGMSGDLSGWLVQWSELASLAALVVGPPIVVLLKG